MPDDKRGTDERGLDLEPGEILFRPGDPVEAVHILRTGQLEARLADRSGRPTVVRRHERPGAIVCEWTGRLDRRTTSVRAASRSSVVGIALGAGGVAAFVAGRPAFGLSLARELAGQSKELGERFGIDAIRLARLGEPIDAACREFLTLFTTLRRTLAGAGGLAGVFERVEASRLVDYARRLPPEPLHVARARQLARLGTEELERAGFVADGDRFRSLPAGMTVCEAGEVAHDFFFLFRGRMEATVDGTPVGTIEPGEFAGEVTALLDLPVRTATLTTLEPCRVMIIERRGFEALMTGQPSLLAQLARSLSRRIEALDLEIVELTARRDRLKGDLGEVGIGFLASIDELGEALRTVGRERPVADLRRLRAVLADLVEAL